MLGGATDYFFLLWLVRYEYERQYASCPTLVYFQFQFRLHFRSKAYRIKLRDLSALTNSDMNTMWTMPLVMCTKCINHFHLFVWSNRLSAKMAHNFESRAHIILILLLEMFVLSRFHCYYFPRFLCCRNSQFRFYLVHVAGRTSAMVCDTPSMWQNNTICFRICPVISRTLENLVLFIRFKFFFMNGIRKTTKDGRAMRQQRFWFWWRCILILESVRTSKRARVCVQITSHHICMRQCHI